MVELHVVPDDRGRWRVHEDRQPGHLSEHPSATDAELAAWRHAERLGGERIVVHDRYGRTRGAVPLPRASLPRTAC